MFEVGGCVLRIVKRLRFFALRFHDNVWPDNVVAGWEEDMILFFCQDCCHTEPAGTSTI